MCRFQTDLEESELDALEKVPLSDSGHAVEYEQPSKLLPPDH